METLKETSPSRLVAAVLTLDPHADFYRIRLDPQEAASFARLSLYDAGAEEGEEGPLTRLLGAVEGMIPLMDYGPGNPNTGEPSHTYEVGRECSRVVYLDWPRAYAPNDFDWPALEARLREIGEEAGADEYGPEEDGAFGFRYRFWWD